MERAWRVGVLASARLVKSPGPVDTKRRVSYSNSVIFTSSFRLEVIWDLYFRKLVNKPT